MVELLARLGDDAFWAARYLERVENLARLLQVNDTAGQEAMGPAAWSRIVEINGDIAAFGRHGEATRQSVCDYYLFDAANPSSVVTALSRARGSLRAMRHLISTELWRQVNVFANTVRADGPERFASDGLSAYCDWLKFNCQAVFGIVDGTVFREEAYLFYMLGRYIELADQTSRLLDATLRGLELTDLPAAGAGAHWQSALRSAGGYHAFKRYETNRLNRTDVANFLLRSKRFPRSIASALDGIDDQFDMLRREFHLRPDVEAMERLDALRALVAQTDVDSPAFRTGLDSIQGGLIALTARIGRSYFNHE
ncbi:MAG: alpha-E domain-containing protein [Pseudomonadota bacterium]